MLERTAEGRTVRQGAASRPSLAGVRGRRSRLAGVGLAILAIVPPGETASAPRAERAMRLPETVREWRRESPARRVEPAGIFDYMDGAGELYLGYRFRHLDVSEYRAPDGNEILVELYRMGSADDAYGLLSGDWGGEAVALDASWPPGIPRALYGGGLLRLWSDNLYARVLATRETASARDAVIELGRDVVAGRPTPPPPALVRALPDTLPAGWSLRRDHTTFFRSHLVLNSLYFLATTNVLRLGRTTEAVMARYDAAGAGAASAPVRVLAIRYADPAHASAALDEFRKVFLRATSGTGKKRGTSSGTFKVEDGWLGYTLEGSGLVLLFQSPDEATVRLALERAGGMIHAREAIHD